MNLRWHLYSQWRRKQLQSIANDFGPEGRVLNEALRFVTKLSGTNQRSYKGFTISWDDLVIEIKCAKPEAMDKLWEACQAIANDKEKYGNFFVDLGLTPSYEDSIIRLKLE